MNRRVADGVVGLVVAAVLALGLVASWQAYQRAQAFSGMMGGMMGGTTGGMAGGNFLWYGLGTVVAAALIVGVYATVRDDLVDVPPDPDRAKAEAAEPLGRDSIGPAASTPSAETSTTGSTPPADRRVLDLLPDDERRVLEPVLASPGLTQIELRDRAEFSKSKVSQTVSALEKRGLLYRERQGRTYRVYPDESVVESTQA